MKDREPGSVATRCYGSSHPSQTKLTHKIFRPISLSALCTDNLFSTPLLLLPLRSSYTWTVRGPLEVKLVGTICSTKKVSERETSSSIHTIMGRRETIAGTAT